MQTVKSYLNEVSTKMNFRGLADAVDAFPEGPSGQRAMTNFATLIHGAEMGMNKKINECTASVGAKMKVCSSQLCAGL